MGKHDNLLLTPLNYCVKLFLTNKLHLKYQNKKLPCLPYKTVLYGKCGNVVTVKIVVVANVKS